MNNQSNFAQISSQSDAFEFVRSTEENTIHFGGFTIRSWGNNLHVITVGDSAEGKTPVEIDGFEAVAGLFNAMAKFVDNPGMFSTFTKKHHIYSGAANRTNAQSAGYALVTETDRTLGLPVNVWYALSKKNNGFEGEAVRPVSYNQSRTWKTEAARNENEHKRHIVALHNGFNLLLDLMEGNTSISFKTFEWSDKSKTVLAGKKFAMTQEKAYREALEAEGELRNKIAVGARVVDMIAAVGGMNVKEQVVSYRDEMMNVVATDLAGLVGHIFTVHQANGSALNARYSINTQERAAYYWSVVKQLGAGAYLQIAE